MQNAEGNATSMTSVRGAAEDALRAGDPHAALQQLQEDVRARPADARLRVFLFQLLCVLGQWERALNQLKVATSLDAGALAMAQMYGEAVRCEAMRQAVFEGRRSPMVLGEPEQWLALLIESLLLAGRGDARQAERMRQQAFEEAEPSRGAIDGRPVEWIGDADSRLGPVLEAVINGRYYWVPFSRVSRIALEAPSDLRDVVWMPVQLHFANGGEAVALIPTRYPGSHESSDGLVVLARKTSWTEVAPDVYHGLGQRLLATEGGEVPLMDVRTVEIESVADGG
jgi:type VI secretion system protein ImpE